jgi:iron(II)-dependent oxidoreductase
MTVTDAAELSSEGLRARLAQELTVARARTTELTGSVDDADLAAQHSPLMSPLVWDLAHIGNQEELWLVRDVGGREPVRSDIDSLYDAFQHPRRTRPTLPLLNPAQSRDYVRQVRDKAFDVLDQAALHGDPLVERGFVFAMIAQHEQQHCETMLATHQLRSGPPVLSSSPPPAAAPVIADEVVVPAGEFEMGTSTHPWALDNERQAHRAGTNAFAIDRYPTTCGEYLEFIADDGYAREELWSAGGWRHRTEAGLTAPLFWERDASGWYRTEFGRTVPIDPAQPVLHVCYYEAEAYARWRGKRLPTETEWEKAARFDPATGASSAYPWGDTGPDATRANLGQRHLSPAPIGAYPDGASPLGVQQLIGDVWEWTSSDFVPYHGFRAYPYEEYSLVFFGSEYKVLRGGSFATDPVVARSTFRNWDYPIRRQIFSGFRLARDL